MVDPLFLGPISTESLIRRAFETLLAGASTFTVVVGIVMLPSLLVSIAEVLQPATAGEPLLQPRQVIGATVVMLAGLLAQAAVIYGVFRQLRGESASIGHCFARGSRRLLPVIGATLLVGLAMLGTMFATLVPFFLLGALFPPISLLAFAGIGIIAYVYCGLFLTIPVVVTEDVGPLIALSRSWKLTDGYRGRIFFILLVIGIFNLVYGVIVLLLSGQLTDLELGLTTQLALVPVTYFGQVVMVAFASVVAAVAYHDLRAAKEGLDEDDLAAIFD